MGMIIFLWFHFIEFLLFQYVVIRVIFIIVAIIDYGVNSKSRKNLTRKGLRYKIDASNRIYNVDEREQVPS